MENSNALYNYNEPNSHTVALFKGRERSGSNIEHGADSYSHCFCGEPDSDGKEKTRNAKAKEKFFKKCFRVCLLSCIIIGYTFMGAVLFLVNEDNVSVMTEQLTSALISEKLVPASTNVSAYKWFSRLGEESRNKAVQNIWNITVSLNILYRQNWTILATEELNIFQEKLLEKLWQEKTYLEAAAYNQDVHRGIEQPPTHWKLGKAFLYSMSILSTIGFGNTIARSFNGKLATMLYATIGLPVMYMYLSSMGSLLSNCARHVFSRTLCCCLCSKCGYCCYDEQLMVAKERRTKRKRQQREYQQQIAAAVTAQHSQPFYVKSSSLNSLEIADTFEGKRDSAAANDSANCYDSKMHNEYSRFVAPLVVCFMLTFSYVLLGSFVLLRLDVNWTLIDSIYFSFMLITTVGMGDSMPFGSALMPNAQYVNTNNSLVVWFVSFYIFIGLGFSAMCYCTIHDGVKRKMNRLYAFSDRLRQSRSKCMRTTQCEFGKEMVLCGTTDIS